MTEASSAMDSLLTFLNPAVLQGLAFSSLFLLLFGVGLELKPQEVSKALIGAPYFTILIVNFIWIPLLSVTLIQWLGISPSSGWAMILLAVAPFAPVVPLFVRMARGNLPLAAGMTALFPLFSAFLTPLSLTLCRWLINPPGTFLEITSLAILKLLFLSITLPLLLGVALHQSLGSKSRIMALIINGLAETVGACSLIALTLNEWPHLQELTAHEITAMILAYELSYLMGAQAQTTTAGSRIALGLGAANRNIGLAVLIALQFFKGNEILAPLVGNSLLIIFLGLCHAGMSHWHWRQKPLLANSLNR